MGLALMFSALEAKTRRLHVIQSSVRMLKRVKITDSDLVLRVLAMTALAVGYLTALVMVWPIQIRERIVHRERLTLCEWDDTASTLYSVLFGFIVVALFMIGRVSWALKETNEVYNESVYIGLILYGTTLLIAGYLGVAMVDDGSLRIALESLLATFLVVLVVGTLMLPKFGPILKGTVYHPDSLKFDTVAFSTSLLNKDDVRRMRQYLRKFGYAIEEDDGDLLLRNALSLTKSQPLPNLSEEQLSNIGTVSELEITVTTNDCT